MADTVKAKKAKSAPKAAPAQAKDRVADVAAKTDVKTDAAVKQAKSVETQPEVKAEKIAAENKERACKSGKGKGSQERGQKAQEDTACGVRGSALRQDGRTCRRSGIAA